MCFHLRSICSHRLAKERQAQMYREDLEKMRLAARRENYCHYEVSLPSKF